MNRRTFLQATAAAGGLAAFRNSLATAAAASDDELLQEAKTRIETQRQADCLLTARNATGQPLPQATVRAEQRQHRFGFGANFFMFDRVGDPAREEAYRQRFAALLNYATLGFYWAAYERERGKPAYDSTDKAVAWCQARGIVCKGHPLVWDFADPRWLPREFAEIRDLSHARVREIVTRYRGRIDLWDVVNEPTHLGRFNTRTGEWAVSLGPVPYVTEHLEIARAANPNATLLVNDYRTDPAYYQILDALRDGGRLRFDVVGIQSHMHGGGWPLRRIWEVCDTYGRLGLPLHFTETTIVSGPRRDRDTWGETTAEGERRQAEYVSKFYTMLFAHPAVQALIWWDLSDHGAWQRAPAGWLRKDMSPKPVYDVLLELIRGKWWTKTQGQTDAAGTFAWRAFHGRHLLRVQALNGPTRELEITVEPGRPNRFEVAVE